MDRALGVAVRPGLRASRGAVTRARVVLSVTAAAQATIFLPTASPMLWISSASSARAPLRGGLRPALTALIRCSWRFSQDLSSLVSVATFTRPRRVPLGVEVMLGFGVGGACFAVVAVIVAVAESDVLVAVVGMACIAAVVAIARRWGVAYAAPAAIASLVAFDWFQFPPTHAREFPGPGDLASLLAYIAVAVLIGELAAYAGRRADVTELARSELAGEQAALRRVATLVARGASPDEVFAAVAAEVVQLLGVDGARVVRYAGDEEVVQLAGWSAPGYDAPALGRAKLEPTSLAGEVFRTGRAARIDDYDAVNRRLPRPVPRSGVGAPIVVDGRLWGAIA